MTKLKDALRRMQTRKAAGPMKFLLKCGSAWFDKHFQ